jgi:hypothetical protein
MKESSECCHCLRRFQVELLTQGRQVGLIDTDTVQLHLGHRRKTLPLQNGSLC